VLGTLTGKACAPGKWSLSSRAANLKPSWRAVTICSNTMAGTTKLANGDRCNLHDNQCILHETAQAASRGRPGFSSASTSSSELGCCITPVPSRRILWFHRRPPWPNRDRRQPVRPNHSLPRASGGGPTAARSSGWRGERSGSPARIASSLSQSSIREKAWARSPR
jgi:hypothetical protein